MPGMSESERIAQLANRIYAGPGNYALVKSNSGWTTWSVANPDRPETLDGREVVGLFYANNLGTIDDMLRQCPEIPTLNMSDEDLRDVLGLIAPGGSA